MQHDQFQELLDALVKRSGVGQEVLGEVMARTSLRTPDETSRVEISAGNPTARRPVDQHEIPQGTVSKAVKALMDEGLLEDGEKLLRNPEGRTLSPLRLGRLYATAGVKIAQAGERPRHVTTALFGLDSSRVLGTAHDAADSWDQAADLIHRHVTSLKSACDRDRASLGLQPLRMLGVGIELGAPVYGGQIMPLSRDPARQPVPLAEKLHCLFQADPGFGRPLPVIVENDVNALTVLAIHQVHYTDPDLVVVGVFNEGVGGGLVMDGRLRRGANGRAMEIGHLAVGFPRGEDPEQEPDGSEAGFGARCLCGQVGHVNTLATPSRIVEEFGAGTLEQISEIRARDAQFKRAQEVFKRAGTALGRALAHVSNTVNPSWIVMYLPPALVDAADRPDTAGAAYLTAVRTETCRAFAASDEPAYLRIRPFPPDPHDVALLVARAAAVCVLESFIEHALRLDGCKPGPRRGNQPPAGPLDGGPDRGLPSPAQPEAVNLLLNDCFFTSNLLLIRWF
jgi:predicted NBD/HSP70 family sugar kinase